MKRLFYLKTCYQMIFAIQMVNTIYRQDKITFLISNDSKAAEDFVNKVNENNIVEKALFIKTKNLIYEKKNSEKIKDFIQVSLCNNNQYKRFIKSIIDESYDEFIFFNYGVDTVAFYNLLVKKNLKLKVSCIEEGILSYGMKFDSGHGKITEISYFTRKLLGKPNLKDNLNNFYCFYPTLYRGSLIPVQVPRVGVGSETANLLKTIFSPDISGYTQKYIFFTSVYDFEGGNSIGEYELVCKVAEIVGKENLLVKIHPRDCRTIYIDNGFNVDKNSSIPWEAIQLAGDFSEYIFLTVNSASVLAGSFMSEHPIRTYYLYKLCDLQENEKARIAVNNINNLINNEKMKHIFKSVSMPERIEDIL